jgi:DNA polymerase-3 subunit alpha
VLGLKTTDVIENTLRLIPDKINIENLPEDDPLTFQKLSRGQTAGVFQLESQGMTDLVKAIKPQNFRDMIPLVALYRPGTLDSGMVSVYVRRKTGTEEIRYLHPKLEPILKETYGIILYQEQIMELVQSLAGWSLGKADILRRVIGRKETELMQEQINQFIADCEKNEIETEIANAIANQIITFAKYGFNKSHSCSYGYTAFITAYLKAHYPLQFMCSLINSESKQEDILPYIDECKRLGIIILPPDITKMNMEWIIEGKAIRMGLAYIKNVGHKVVIEPNFKSFDAFMYYNYHLSKKVIDSLIKAGAMDGFGISRGDMIQTLEPYKEYRKEIEKCNDKIKLYASKDRWTKAMEWKEKKDNLIPPAKSGKDYNEIAGENEVLSFTFQDEFAGYDKQYCGDNVIIGKITAIKYHIDRKGKQMAFIKIKTPRKGFDVTIFASTFAKVKQFIQINNVCLFGIQDGILSDMEPAKRI